MPRSVQTKLTKRVQQLESQITAMKAFLRMKEEELEDIHEVIRTKGPYTKKHLNEYYLLDQR